MEDLEREMCKLKNRMEMLEAVVDALAMKYRELDMYFTLQNEIIKKGE